MLIIVDSVPRSAEEVRSHPGEARQCFGGEAGARPLPWSSLTFLVLVNVLVCTRLWFERKD